MGHVLVVEDDHGIRETVAELLTGEGWEVVVACDGLEGLEQVARRRPGLILLDLHMPALGGEGFLARLRADPATRDIPVVVMSGSMGHPGAKLPVAEAFLPKPFELDELLATVRRLMPGTP